MIQIKKLSLISAMILSVSLLAGCMTPSSQAPQKNNQNGSTTFIPRSFLKDIHICAQDGYKMDVACALDNQVQIDVPFTLNEYEVSKPSAPVMETLILYLNKNPDRKLEIQGFSNDNNPLYNHWLSIKRALSVYNYLIEHNVSSKQLIIIKKQGKSTICQDDNNASCMQWNKRVKLTLY